MRIQSTTLSPDSTSLTFTPQGVLELPIVLPVLVQGIIGRDKRDWDIFIKRHGLVGNRKYTLAQLGAAYQIDRERVRQLQERAEKNLTEFLDTGELKGRPERLHPQFRSEIKKMAAFLNEIGFPMSDNELWTNLSKRYNSDIIDDERIYLNILLDFLGITQCKFAPMRSSDPSIAFWVRNPEQEFQSLQALEITTGILRSKVGSETAFDLQIAINLELRKSGLPSVSENQLHRFLSWNPMIELHNEKYRLLFFYLLSNELRAERVLQDQAETGRKSMSASALTREINLLHVKAGRTVRTSVQTISQACTASPTIIRVGGTGEWALKQIVHEEGIEVRDIHLLMEEALILLNAPATANQIHQEVSRKREIKLQTVHALLAQHPRKFVNIDRGLWALRDWNFKVERTQEQEVVERRLPRQATGMRGIAQECARKLLQESPSNQMSGVSLVTEVEKETYFDRRVIYNAISHMHDVERLGGRRGIYYRLKE